MTIGKKYFREDHTWHLGPNIQLVNGNSLEILGVSYNAGGTNTDHVTNRISKCRQSFYGLRDSGMSELNKATRSPEISREQVQKLTPQFLLYIYIGYRFPLSLIYYLGKPPSS